MNEAMTQQAETAEAAAGSSLGNLAGKATREKTWDESDSERRMAMMRDEVRWLRRIVTDLQNEARKVKHHQHAQDGSLMVPMTHRDNDENRPRGYFYDPLK